MDYVVGSIAALISGNVTPNRPKLIRRALTPTKHPSSPNVTPKSEFVEDRSIFLSPTQQKKKAIIKKSPKRIFENPDLDITENSESSSPKADKVKKHLKEELEADEMGKSSLLTKKSPSNKLDKSPKPVYPNKKPKANDSQVDNESTPKKKKKKDLDVSNKVEEMEVEQINTEVDKKEQKSLKKKQKQKSAGDDHMVDIVTEINEAAKESIETPKETRNIQEGKKKKNKKRKKKNKQAKPVPVTDTVEDKSDDKIEQTAEKNEDETAAKSPKKKKNRKNKNKKAKLDAKESKPAKIEQDVTSTKVKDDDTSETEEVPKSIENQSDDDDDDENDEDGDQSDDDESDEEISNIANPNAITEMDTDSEHDSDDEIESENDDEDLKTENAMDSSDDEAEVKSKKATKKKKKKEAAKKTEDKEEGKEIGSPEKEVNTEEEVKRTLFVGNVPFSNKCKKEIKKIFAEYGEIETVRIRTVPVKDARVTPKLAVIKNEIHPDRSTVNVYVKFTDPHSVERALSANNTVLNQHHLRVSRSSSTGVEHDPRCAIFLGNLPFGIEDETLRAKFEKCGEIESVRIVRDKKTNAGKGFGYVNFTSKDGVALALGLSEEDLTVKNRIIRVKRCTQTLSNGAKNSNKSHRGGRSEIGNNDRPNKNFGNNRGPRNSGNNQGPNRFGNQNRNNQGPSRNFGNNQGQRNFGNNQGQNRNFGNQGPSRNFGNNQGPNRNFGNNQGPRNFGNNQNKFGNQDNDKTGASRRIMNKRPNQESGEGPPNKKQNVSQPPREKKQKKEFVGMTGEKKKKHKFDKGSKKKKALSEIMTKT